MNIISIIIGAAVLLNGILLCAFSNFNMGVLLTLFAGIFFVLIGVFCEKMKQLCQKGIFKAIKIAVIFLMCAETALLGFLFVYGQSDNAGDDEEAVVVLGAAVHGETISLPLKQRLDAAVKYHEKNPAAVIIVTGGQGFQESVTEAEAMQRYLVSRGISPEKIIKEEKATSTSENMKFSKEIADAYFGGGYKVAVVTNNFHIYRSVCIAKKEGFEHVSHLHAGLKWYSIVPCYLRESLAVVKFWIFGQ